MVSPFLCAPVACSSTALLVAGPRVCAWLSVSSYRRVGVAFPVADAT